MASKKSSTSNLRSKTEINLVGQPCANILGTKLPSKKQVLKMFFYGTRIRGLKNEDSADLVTDTVMIFWRQAFIPTKYKHDVKKKVLSLHGEWEVLQKSTHRKKSQTQQKKEKDFVEDLDNLFDIQHEDALQMIVNEEDAEFLRQQMLKGRPGCMLGVDASLFRQQKRRQERETQNELRAKRAKLDAQIATAGEFLLH